jgi:hypothetical protein
VRLEGNVWDMELYSIEQGVYSLGNSLGQLWVAYSDWAADTGGKFRASPKQTATLAADSFVHVTLQVDTATSGRRYPQIMISDSDVAQPVQENLISGRTVNVETIGSWSYSLEIQYCDHRVWDVNNQCPKFQLYQDAASDAVPPNDNVAERTGVDRPNQFDVYVSTTRVYVFFDERPFGCGILPADSPLNAGDAHVTFGDVLYHSGVDVPSPPYFFHQEHLHIETRRHYDNFGFSSGVAAPTWNETLLPCRTELH